MISLIIPVYNEQDAVVDTVKRSSDAMTKTGDDFEIIVINDGSSDATQQRLEEIKETPYLRIITNDKNRGYGAGLKTGIRKSKGNLIATIDADGTYPIEDLPRLIQILKDKDADMVVGARTKKMPKNTITWKIGKIIINFLANKVAGMKIPDNNSGMRVFTRELGEKYMHLYPQRFSFTLTITLAALTDDYRVIFEPIDYFKRIGKSALTFRHGCGFFGILLRITTYFRPLKFFLVPGSILMGAGLATIISTIINNSNISDGGLLLLLTGIQVTLFGVLAEVLVRQGRRTR